MPQLEHTFRRLGAMGPREIAHRLREKGYTGIERLGLLRSDPELRAGSQFRKYLFDSAAVRFYAGPRQDVNGLFRERFPSWIDRAKEEADRLCRHEIQILGYGPVQLGPVIDWHRDPITGKTWERLFWTAYNPELNHAGRDVKNVHELNRCQHLPRLAKAWRLTGDERYAAEAMTQMIGWIEQNPPEIGINWQSSLEIAIRAISWLWTIFLLLESKSFDDGAAARIGDSLFAQLDHVFRHTSEFSSPNTHLIGEAAALFIGGMVFHDRKRPAAWLESGATLLEREIRKQVLNDGVDAELSSYYHCYALDFFLQAAILAEYNRYPLDPEVRGKIAAMAAFLRDIARADGTLPLLGDDDGGRALALQERQYRSTCGLVALARQSGPHTEEAFWLLGREALEIEGELQAPEEAFYAAAGYAIQRSGESRLIFDCGALGMLTAGHSHADSLSIVLSKGSRDLLVDPGTFIYNSAAEWRSYFRSTRAHNTVVIDECDQAERTGTFSWKNTLAACGTRGEGYIEGEHDGYASLGVIHRRRMVQIAPEFWIIADDFRGSGEHTFDFHYHFGNDVDVSNFDGAGIHDARAGLSLGLFASHPLRMELIEGWVSSGYGEKHAGVTLRASTAGSVPASALTFLSTGGERPVFRQIPMAAPDAVAAASKCAGYEYIAFVSGGEFTWTRRCEEALCAQFAAL